MKSLILLLSLVSFVTFVEGTAEARPKKKKATDRGYKVFIIPAEMNQIKKELNKEYEVYQPRTASQGDTGDRVVSKVGDQVVQKWLDSEAGAGVAQSVKKVENSMRAEVAVKPKEKNGTEHKFGFNVKAVEATTELKYTGWFKSTLKYDARDSQASVEVSEKVLDRELYLKHTADRAEEKSSVGMSWSW